MRTIVVPASAALSILLAGSVAQAKVTERTFMSGGTVRLDLAAGDYEIVASKDDHIRVSWDDRGKAAEVTLRIDVNASRATLRTETPWKDGPTIRIELPRRTNMVVRLTAGT